jgi:hypothetical protein
MALAEEVHANVKYREMPEVTEHKNYSDAKKGKETAKTFIGPMLPFLCVVHGETQGPAGR